MATISEFQQQLVDAVGVVYPTATQVQCVAEDAGVSPRFGSGRQIRLIISAILPTGLYFANTIPCIVQGYGEPGEVAGWLERIPEILVLAQPVTKIATLAQVQAAINAKLPNGGVNGDRIINQQVQIYAEFATVGGLFPVGTTREQRTYVLYKTDPTAPLSLGNTSYDRLVGETAAPES